MEKLTQSLRSFEQQRGDIGKTLEDLQSIFNELVEREKEILTEEKRMKDQELKFKIEYGRISELKESQLKKVEASIHNCLKELSLKEEEFNVVASKTKLEEQRLEAIQNSVKECSCQLESEKKELEYVKAFKENNLASLKKTMVALEKKKVELESIIQLQEEEMESRLKELELMEKHVQDILKEAQLKEKSASSARKFVAEAQKNIDQHQQKELEFEIKVDEFQRRLQQFELEKSAWLAEKNKMVGVVVKIEQQQETRSKGPLPDVEVSIQNLIEIEEVIHAVKLICQLKLTNKFSPVSLLLDYIKNSENQTSIVCRGKRSNKDKIKAANKEIAILKAVKNCIQDCNLESVFPKVKFYQLGQRCIELEQKLELYSLQEQSGKRKKDDSIVGQRIKIKY
ncbi:hypothetical protein CsatB_008549 [Cannabis sativa]|uniref:FRIGIDA-like protein n=2 Tax=Cannabis sativa TaxID=3483 RepID=A0A803NMG9_CANSA|nr:uncharacterized protein LOC115703109 [Cannabis sativa]